MQQRNRKTVETRLGYKPSKDIEGIRAVETNIIDLIFSNPSAVYTPNGTPFTELLNGEELKKDDFEIVVRPAKGQNTLQLVDKRVLGEYVQYPINTTAIEGLDNAMKQFIQLSFNDPNYIEYALGQAGGRLVLLNNILPQRNLTGQYNTLRLSQATKDRPVVVNIPFANSQVEIKKIKEDSGDRYEMYVDVLNKTYRSNNPEELFLRLFYPEYYEKR